MNAVGSEGRGCWALDDCVRKKPVSVRRDATEEVLKTENSRPLKLNELRSTMDGDVDGTSNESADEKLAWRDARTLQGGVALGLAAA